MPVILAELRADQISGTNLAPTESSDSTMSATSTLYAGSESSLGSNSNNFGSSSDGSNSGSSSGSSTGFNPDSSSSSLSNSGSSSGNPMGSADFGSSSSSSGSGSSGSQHKKKKKLPETDVFGEPPHTGLSNDEVDLVARHILATARKARCAQEDEYCQLEFKNCKDEQCRRKVESQSSLSSSEKQEISKLLRN